MTHNKKIILFSFFVMFIILASVNSISAAPGGGSTYYVNGHVKTEGGVLISGAKVDLYLDTAYVGTVYTNTQGYFTGSAQSSSRPRTWKAVASKAGFTTGTKYARVLPEVPTSMGTIYLLSTTIRIGVFFWASDTHTQTYINEYKSVLQSRGYTKFFDFKDSTNFAADFAAVDAFEDADDVVFFFIAGHGGVHDGHSRTDVRGVSGTTYIQSDDFRTYCDSLESAKIGLLVGSCYSGYWPDDMEGGGYLTMSACDFDERAGLIMEQGINVYEVFSNKWFYYVSIGYKAISAYNAANTYVLQHQDPTWPQHPQVCNECPPPFFIN